MKKFKYYIMNTFDGAIQGTDDADKAEELAECEDFFVLCVESGAWMQPGQQRVQVEPYPRGDD